MATRTPRPDQQDYTLHPLTPTRQAIGDRTRRSVTEKPHFWMSTQIDCTAMVEHRKALRDAGAEVVPTYNDYILRAVALTLRDHPTLNAWTAEDGLHILRHINVGFAVATDQGVLLPTVMDADQKPLAAIARETKELVELARTGKLRASLQMGAGFTISNVGPTEVDAFMAVISPPQTGILAIGAMKSRPVVLDGQVVARNTIICTLSLDHAAVDGAHGAHFLGDLKKRLEAPEGIAAL